MSKHPHVVGLGSPIMDILAQVSDDFIAELDGEKGGMVLIDDDAMGRILSKHTGPTHSACGGSAANTIFALLQLGLPCSLVGKIGDDDTGRAYRKEFEAIGGDSRSLKVSETDPTARCLSLITPDSQRTMRTNLGAAATIEAEEIVPEDFANATHLHVEGYALFAGELATRGMRLARAAGCTVSLDLASFEVVRATADALPTLLRDSVDIVFANEDEASAFCGDRDPEAGLSALAELCDVAAVKLGKDGALLRRGEETVRVAPVTAREVVDTTGAGDLWGGGFLYAFLNGAALAAAGRCGSILGAEAVQQIGAQIPDARWAAIRSACAEALAD